MAFYDNRLWLLSHIHNSFISSDDTGICEAVLGGNFTEDLRHIARDQGLHSFIPFINEGEQETDDFANGSPDIKIGLGSSERFRKRANTELQLQQKLVQQKENRQQTTVAWKSPEVGSSVSPETLCSLFPKKDVPQPQQGPSHGLSRQEGRVSLLSQRLESLAEGGGNPFKEFARFQGCHYVAEVRRQVEVFPCLGESKVSQPLIISCVKDATVREVVGLVCFLYTEQERIPKLEFEEPHYYGLQMCEEDGTVDSDFPALDMAEVFSKFGFTQLALVQADNVDAVGKVSERVTLFLPDGTFSELEVDRSKDTLGDILSRGLQKRRRTLPSGGNTAGGAGAGSTGLLTYHLEAAEVAGVPLDNKLPLSQHQGCEFYIVRSNSKRMSGPRTDKSDQPVNFLEAPLFQSFDVQMLTKVRTKVEIHLGISGEKVEIDPKPQASWTVYKQKPATYDMDNIVSCQIANRNQGDERLVMKLVHLADSGWRWIEFEGARETIEAVVEKVNHLLDSRQSEARKLRKEYLENKEKKKGKHKISVT